MFVLFSALVGSVFLLVCDDDEHNGPKEERGWCAFHCKQDRNNKNLIRWKITIQIIIIPLCRQHFYPKKTHRFITPYPPLKLKLPKKYKLNTIIFTVLWKRSLLKQWLLLSWIRNLTIFITSFFFVANIKIEIGTNVNNFHFPKRRNGMIISFLRHCKRFFSRVNFFFVEYPGKKLISFYNKFVIFQNKRLVKTTPVTDVVFVCK